MAHCTFVTQMDADQHVKGWSHLNSTIQHVQGSSVAEDHQKGLAGEAQKANALMG